MVTEVVRGFSRPFPTVFIPSRWLLWDSCRILGPTSAGLSQLQKGGGRKGMRVVRGVACRWPCAMWWVWELKKRRFVFRAVSCLCKQGFPLLRPETPVLRRCRARPLCSQRLLLLFDRARRWWARSAQRMRTPVCPRVVHRSSGTLCAAKGERRLVRRLVVFLNRDY